VEDLCLVLLAGYPKLLHETAVTEAEVTQRGIGARFTLCMSEGLQFGKQAEGASGAHDFGVGESVAFAAPKKTSTPER